IAPDGGAADGIRRRRLDGRGPGGLVRALDAEDQLRPFDAVLLAGGRERLLARAAPGALRGAVEPLRPGDAPAATVSRLQRQLRRHESS
ncbi:MAG TPA: hypothetical protein VHA54_00415, partial [Solirubrobacterales bacterium]|nr:hypothetical protein [Solirubrobacterales bacterium]